MPATLGKLSLEPDADATRRIYASIESGGAERCGCAYCRNFLAQLPDVFPDEVLAFFEQCGIDVRKDTEVYNFGEVRPGHHSFGGEYYFICKALPSVDADSLPNGFQFTVMPQTPLVPQQFKDIPGVRCLNFIYEIPWVLNERP
ncbi:hypothetical protein AGMMS49545_06370 [Betaproteobacteria bacterium]|nr:hypothetical protein AGMMS49545_06370 [Betaproteobacteria bacterium]GHU49473.1 hypothetical protein AGMMS50289_26530 [Betaproteobacteria bacterium]